MTVKQKLHELAEYINAMCDINGTYLSCETELNKFMDIAHNQHNDDVLRSAWSEINDYGEYDDMDEKIQEIIDQYLNYDD